jgi:branched-chain amino acid transport system substrate-binding protein
MKLKKNIFIFTIIILMSSSIQTFAKIVGNNIVFGFSISLTGKYSSEGELLKNNQKKFIDNINKNEGIKISGKIYKLDIIYYDNESNDNRANQLTRRLIENEGVQFLIGPINLKLSNEIQNLISDNQLPIVSSFDALEVYIDAFKTVDSVDSKKIRKYIIDNK